MRRLLLTAAFVALAAQANAPSAKAGLAEAAELESARANARAGGPVSDRDAELLDRYGCLSGTDSPACRRGEVRQHRSYHRRKPAKSNDE